MMTHNDATQMNENLKRIATALEKFLYQYSGIHTPVQETSKQQQLEKERT